MAYSRRAYKGAPVSNALGGSGLAANATSITLATAMSGWSTSGTPFFVVVDPGTAKEEKICVIYSSTTSLTVVDPAVTSGWTASVNGRGADDTTDYAHAVGATIYPVFTATEANQANDVISKYTTNGDIVVHGSTGPKTISTGGSGNNNKVLVADSTVADGGVKWAQINADGIATGAVTSDKILNNTIALGDLATALQAFLVPIGTITAYAGASAPAGWLLCNGDAFSSATYPSLYSVLGNVATTPNLIGKFPMGKTASSTGSTLLGTGGTNTIGETHLPAHAHSVGTLATTNAGSHSHSGGTGYAGTHNHTYTQTTVTQRAVFNTELDLLDDVIQATVATDTGNAGNHFHTISEDGTHGHTLTGATANKGDGSAYFQPFVAVNYIIKHD
jgi:microcystin-dependent protein